MSKKKKNDVKSEGPAFRKVYKVEDLVNRNVKNESLVPFAAAGIVQEAFRTSKKEIGQFFAQYVNLSSSQMALLNAEQIAESYFGMLQNSKVVSAHGYDLDNGVDVKTVTVRPGSVTACIGNCKNKKMISVLIDVQEVRVIESIAPIPTPGDANHVTIPLTKNGLVWKNYEYSHCFRPQDVEEDDERGVGITDKWAVEEKVHFFFTEEVNRYGKLVCRYRTCITPKKLENIKKNNFTPICEFRGREIELDSQEFLRRFGDIFSHSKNVSKYKYTCSVAANEDGTIRAKGIYASIFPESMHDQKNKKLR